MRNENKIIMNGWWSTDGMKMRLSIGLLSPETKDPSWYVLCRLHRQRKLKYIIIHSFVQLSTVSEMEELRRDSDAELNQSEISGLTLVLEQLLLPGLTLYFSDYPQKCWFLYVHAAVFNRRFSHKGFNTHNYCIGCLVTKYLCRNFFVTQYICCIA
jgi:hypothetical protein